MALNKRKTHLNLSGSHHTLDSDNAFIGGTAYITGSLKATVSVSGSQLTGSKVLVGTLSGDANIGPGTGVVIDTGTRISGGFIVDSDVGASFGLNGNTFRVFSGSFSDEGPGNYGFQVDSTEDPGAVGVTIFGNSSQYLNSNNSFGFAVYSGSSGNPGFAITPAVGADKVKVELNGVNVTSNLSPITGTLTIDNNANYPNPTSASFSFDPSLVFGSILNEKGMGAINFDLLGFEVGGRSFAKWSYSVTYVSSSGSTGLTPLSPTEYDFITSSVPDSGFENSTWDVAFYNDCTFAVTGAAGKTIWYAKISEILFFTSPGNKPY